MIRSSRERKLLQLEETIQKKDRLVRMVVSTNLNAMRLDI